MITQLSSICIYCLCCFCIFTAGGDNDYVDAILKQRKKKDKEFRNPQISPLSDEERKSFKGLRYFPVDTIYRLKAQLTILEHQEPVHFPTTKEGSSNTFIKYAEVSFYLKEKDYKLMAYQRIGFLGPPKSKKILFLPFFDESNGEQTYGGGRFLAPEMVTEDSILLDFNLAYNPYCVFSENYVCPLVPKENKLTVKVEAGEKMYYLQSEIHSERP